jgi:hypothetical protein
VVARVNPPQAHLQGRAAWHAGGAAGGVAHLKNMPKMWTCAQERTQGAGLPLYQQAVRLYLALRGPLEGGDMGRLTPLQRDQLVQEYLQGKPSTTLAQDFGLSVSAICRLLDRRGLERRTPAMSARKYTLNEHAFETIIEESAYWIGFLTADGTILNDENDGAILLKTAECDRGHLEKFQSFLQAGHKVVYHASEPGRYSGSTGFYRIAIYSKPLVISLQQYGLLPNKTGNESIHLLATNRHFWRGVVDGDGYIGISGNSPRLEVVGNAHLLQQFIDFLNLHLPECTNPVRPHRTIFRVGFYGKTARGVIAHLYCDCSVALERKQRIARQIISQEP